MQYFILGVLIWALTVMFMPSQPVTDKVWYEGERICRADGSNAEWARERRLYQHTIKCKNGRVFRFDVPKHK